MLFGTFLHNNLFKNNKLTQDLDSCENDHLGKLTDLIEKNQNIERELSQLRERCKCTYDNRKNELDYLNEENSRLKALITTKQTEMREYNIRLTKQNMQLRNKVSLNKI